MNIVVAGVRVARMECNPNAEGITYWSHDRDVAIAGHRAEHTGHVAATVLHALRSFNVVAGRSGGPWGSAAP
jgi:hypothetical protein